MLSLTAFGGWVFVVADGSGASTIVTRTRARKPLLGRMSVFIIGILVGVALGVVITVMGAPLLDELYPSAFASAPATPSPAAAKPAPPAAAGLAALFAPPAAKAAPDAAKADASPSTPSQLAAATAAPPVPQALHVAAGRPLVIGVFGDSLGDGMWAGLYHQLRDGKSYEVVKFSRAATGLARYDYVNIQENAAEQLANRHVDIAVVMVGANDEQGIIEGHQVDGFDTPRWRQVYAGRIDSLVGLLRSRGAAVYWVGLPKMRHQAFDQKSQILNALYASRAQALGVPFIPTVPVTVDGNGGYDDYLSEGGRPRLMRAKDGVHMTMAGYLRIASPVSSAIRADVGRAQGASKPQTRADAGDPPHPDAGDAQGQASGQ